MPRLLVLAWLLTLVRLGCAAEAIDALAIERALLVLRHAAPLPGSDLAATAEQDQEDDLALFTGTQTAPPFRRIDRAALAYVRGGRRYPAVQFSCARQLIPEEDALVQALADPDPGIRLEALAVLVAARAGHSITRQWATLQELKSISGPAGWDAALALVDAPFGPSAIDARLAQALDGEPGGQEVECPDDLAWAVRAAGVIVRAESVPALARLSRQPSIDLSIAAELSLEEIPGPAADAALADCMMAWNYNAYVRAGNALLKRDPALVVARLGTAVAPEGCRYQQGLLLAQCDDARAVPLLCASVGRISLVDGTMFMHIARLARVDQRELVEDLPGHVRPAQRAEALRTVAEYRKLLGLR
ncbi:MAG: hypothetical protein H0W83_14340 [Planctomycetes bacterium]|nr:hypothetical protein [Planctomycetota bacterium]